MKTFHITMLVVVLLTLNNIIFYFVFNASPAETGVSVFSEQLEGNTEPELLALSKPLTKEKSKDKDKLVYSLDDQDKIIFDALRRFSETDKFTNAVEQHELMYINRYEDLHNRYGHLSNADLVSLVLDSNSSAQKNEIRGYLLSSSKLDSLEASELKQLYEDGEFDKSSKINLLASLVKRNDPDGLALAKQQIENESGNKSFFHLGVFRDVYKQDPEFIADYVANASLADLNYDNSSTILSDPELARVFYQNNLDEILRSDNPLIFSYGNNTPNLELEDHHESALVNLFSADNTDKRNFALGFVGSIKNVDRLREAYNSMHIDDERRTFLRQLLKHTKDSEHYNLGIELVQSSDHSFQ